MNIDIGSQVPWSRNITTCGRIWRADTAMTSSFICLQTRRSVTRRQSPFEHLFLNSLRETPLSEIGYDCFRNDDIFQNLLFKFEWKPKKIGNNHNSRCLQPRRCQRAVCNRKDESDVPVALISTRGKRGDPCDALVKQQAGSIQ